MRPQKFLALLLLSMFALLAALGVQARPAFAAAHDDLAWWRLVHAAPDISTTDVFIDGIKLLSNFQFGTVTNYQPLPAGTHEVQVAIVGQGIGAAVLTQMLSISVGVPYTMAVLGTKASGYSLGLITDNNSVSGSMAKVRAYDLSPDAGSVNVTTGSNAVINGLAYPQASNYLFVAAGSYTFSLVAIQANASTPVSATLKPWTVTSIFAVGMLSSDPKIQLVSAQVPGTPGVPQTGSDPNALSVNVPPTQPIMLWLLGILVLATIAAGLTTRGLTVARQRTRNK